MTSSARNCLHNFDLKREIKKFDFSLRLKYCNLTKVINVLPYKGDVNSFFVFEWLKYVIEVFVQNIFSFLGLCTNFLTYLTVRKNVKPFEIRTVGKREGRLETRDHDDGRTHHGSR